MEEKKKELTPLYGRLLIRWTKPFPNFDFSFIKPVRRKAVELLNLKPGDRVLDVGCGPGGSIPFLVDAVGPSGRVVGVEISPEHSELSRNRIAKNQWKNVKVIVAAAQDVRLTGTFDGLLMFAAPDVYASEEALENILPHLKAGARIVAFGAKVSSTRTGKLLNPILKMLHTLSFTTTPRPNEEPWQILAKYVEKIEVKEYFFGLMFLVSGSLVTKKADR
jgi:SAM-dependent methyltransferase